MKWYLWLIIALAVSGLAGFIIVKSQPFFSMLKAINSSNKYVKLTSEELLALSDEELIAAVLEKLSSEYDVYGDYKEAVEKMSSIERVILSVADFDMEIQNGGLCQYFTNSSRFSAPYILSALDVVKAVQIKAELTHFITENNVDLSDLEKYSIDDLNGYLENTKMLPFDEFDNKFYELYGSENLTILLSQYIRDNAATLPILSNS